MCEHPCSYQRAGELPGGGSSPSSAHLLALGNRLVDRVRVEQQVGPAGAPLDLGDGGAAPDVNTLTALFFTFYFLAATQDIAVDGLALTECAV